MSVRVPGYQEIKPKSEQAVKKAVTEKIMGSTVKNRPLKSKVKYPRFNTN
jgi:hypothetical protein